MDVLYVQQMNNMDTLQVFSEYFKELEEESIRDNFVIIYELLDELMDFGYPQTTDSKILQEWVLSVSLSVLTPLAGATVCVGIVFQV